MRKFILITALFTTTFVGVVHAHQVDRFSASIQYDAGDIPSDADCKNDDPKSWYCDYPIVERYSSIPIAHPPSNEDAIRHLMMVTEIDNIQADDLLLVEGNIQVSNKEYGTVEFTCRVNLTTDSTGAGGLNTVIQPEAGLNVSPQLYHYRDENGVVRLPIYRDPTGSAADVTHDLFAGMHHYTLNFSATHKVTSGEVTNGQRFVGLVCYAQGSKQTEQGDRLVVDTNGHMSVLRMRP